MSTSPSARAGRPAMALWGGDWRVQGEISSPSRRREGGRDIAGRDGAGAATVAVTGADLGSGVRAGAGAGVGAAAGAGVGAADGTAAARTLFEERGTNQPGRHVHPSPRAAPTTATTTTAATAILPTRRASGGRPSRLRMAAFTVSTSTFRCRPANAVLGARSHKRLITRGTPPL